MMEYWMIRSIRETPKILKDVVKTPIDIPEDFKRYKRILFIGCGSSYYSSLAGAYTFLRLSSEIKAVAFPASEFILTYSNLSKDSLVFLSSRSGETKEIITAAKIVKQQGGKVIGITCNESSTLTKVSDAFYIIRDGEEPNIPATKSFSAITLILQKIAISLLNDTEAIESLEKDISKIPKVAKKIIEDEKEFMKISDRTLANKSLFVHLGSGATYIVTLEGALKFRETSYIANEVFPMFEFRHGPIALKVHKDKIATFLVLHKTCKEYEENIRRFILEINDLKPIIITNNPELSEFSDNTYLVPWSGSEVLSIIPFVIPYQIMAYYLSISLGHDPDNPSGLAKYVSNF
ncbi:SIS domain-containing protein [Pyrococcus kukulkanii]